MERTQLELTLEKINGCTFAHIDATTNVSPGITHVVTGKSVILFTNKNSSGYENMVRRRLVEAGKDPTTFIGGDLPWGIQVPNSPLIEHKGKTYLKCIDLAEGKSEYYMLGEIMSDEEVASLKLRQRGAPNQGLPPSSQVTVSAYNIENIDRIALMGEILVSLAPKRAILSINA